ncbi:MULTISPECIES: acyl-CoA dehydrogenase family protein [Kaistia]|uniref:Acyl-CoA dehydrogenase family protein n=1 Tax=Kaistia nematophila TaxID=2994654 RepID=A0A9X3E287_9HYPH|nr:acyl-CoA dehydrogenase family protein [Kaistia nematophila]MCX5570339.1 acyl-CoA dehydrogenase family protein [Kaistia nematophila]
MTQIDAGWGAGPSASYETLAATFRPVFRQIAAGAVDREVARRLPYEELALLKVARFGALRVPREQGGFGASVPELFALLIELSAADSNVTQALRAHFGFAEEIVSTRSRAWQANWFERLVAGDTVGNAWSEVGEAKQLTFSTRLDRDGERWRLNGTKYYTTGSLFAEWIDVTATGEDDKPVGVLVRSDAPGVEIFDDWDGFGQIGTASGTTVFTNVAIEPAQLVADEGRVRYGQAFFQLIHLATLAGIGRAAALELAEAVAARTRHYSNGAGARSSEDPQVLQVVGRIRAAAYAAGTIVLKAAEAVQRAFERRIAGDEAGEAAAAAIADIEVAQAQVIVSSLVLDATASVFDALGASATRRGVALDRFWRNARTLSSHNPRIYKDRIIGDFAVNGAPHPAQWRIGKVA